MKLKQIEGIQKVMKVNLQTVKILGKEDKQAIQLVVPENGEELQEYIHLQKRTTAEKYNLNQEGIIITEKIAKLLDIKLGDTIEIQNKEERTGQVKVAGITENYLLHYLYLSPQQYQSVFGESIKYNTYFAKTVKMEESEEKALSKKILEDTNISKVSFNSDTKDIFDEVMDNMQFVVWVLIISAGLLAFVVLYNLSNVNISERIRELATIKVLGFYDKEVYDYVTRETILLTIIGMTFGFMAGYILNLFIIKTCELDMFMFDPTVGVMTYVYSGILTILFTVMVNIATYFSLKKINMIDSLKSVE